MRSGAAGLRAAIMAVLIATFFVYPLVRLLVMPFLSGHGAAGDWPAFVVSLLLSVGTAIIAAPLGALFALFTTTAEGPVARAATLTLWGLFLTPSYMLTTGWMIIFSNHALRATLAGQAFFGVGGLMMLYVVKALPFSALVARATLAAADSAPAEAAAIHGVPFIPRVRIGMRLLAPAMAVGFAIAVIETMQEFGIPATLGVTSHVPILTYAIYQHLAETPTDFAGASILCWRLIAVAAVFGGIAMACRRQGAAIQNGRMRPPARQRPAWRRELAFAALTCVFALVGIVIPVVALFARALQPLPVPMPHPGAVLRSLGFGMVGATMSLGVAVLILRLRAAGARRITAVLDVALVANMAVPGLVLGASYIVAFNNDLLPLYGSRLLLLIGYTAGMAPLAQRMMQGALDDLDPNLVAAARLHGLPRLTRLVDIEGMLLIRPFTYAYLLVAAAIMFELPVSELLYPPGATPLGVAIVTLDQMSDYAASARLALFGLGAMAGLALLLAAGVALLAAPRRLCPA